MPLELKHILTGEGMRTWEVQGNALVQDIPGFIQEGPIMGIPWLGLKPKEGLCQSQGLRPGQADNANAPAARRRGESGNGVPVGATHGELRGSALGGLPLLLLDLAVDEELLRHG